MQAKATAKLPGGQDVLELRGDRGARMDSTVWVYLTRQHTCPSPQGEQKEAAMAMNERVSSVLNEQINKELYSAYLYLTFADYYEDRGLKGFANWYEIQAKEEMDHAMAIRRYLLDNDFTPTMEAIAKPDKTFQNDLEPLEAGLEHEEYVTSLIHHCYEVAHEVHDVRTMKFLDWFVSEQGEEETNARDMITNMKLFGSDPKGLYDLDREYQARVYTQMTALPL